MTEKTVTIANQLAELETVAATVEAIAEEWDIPMAVSMNLNLVLEELVTNIIFYGYDDQNEHQIIIRLSMDNRVITIQLEDDGKEFNPLLLADPNIGGTLEERKIGGLGIFFVRKIMDDMAYRREGNKNILTISKNIA